MTLVAIALVFAFAIGNFVFGRAAVPGGIGASPGASATPNSKPPDVTFTQDTCCTQTARYMRAAWTASEKITAAKVAVAPDPGFPCESSVDATGTKGLMTCQGLLRGATDYTANLALTTSRGTFSFEHKFKTMGDKLSGLTWFTEFEDARGDPLACAAASVRIVEKYTTNNDPLPVGFTVTFGTFYDDPANAFSQVIVMDPQRGDMRPETQSHRPDKYRTPGFQTGQPLALDEWYGDEWWLRFTYISPIRMPDGSLLAIDRNDGSYPVPHWAGQFVILVDDADADWPSDKEGRVKWH